MTNLLWMILTLILQSVMIIVMVEYGYDTFKMACIDIIKLFDKGQHDEA